MHKRFYLFLRRPSLSYIILFSAVWCLSILAGAQFVVQCKNAVTPMLHLLDTPSIAVVLMISLLPFLLLTVSLLLALKWVAAVIIAARGFVFSFCSIFLLLNFQYGGWLACILNTFSALVSTGVMLWFAAKHLIYTKASLKRDFLIGFLLIVFSCCVDVFYLRPFL